MKYQYVGDGAGIIGLPHEISDEEAEQLGVGELLRAAIENGSYAPVDSDQSSVSSDQSPVRAARKTKKE